MNDITWMLSEPRFHLGMPVSSVVVHHQVQSCLGWKLAIDVTQKLQEFLLTVALVKIADDPSLKQIQRGEQGGRSVPLVNRGSWFHNDPSSTEDRVGCGLRPESGSFR